MKNKVERLLKDRGLEIKSDKNLTENLKEWRKIRNITNPNTHIYVASIIEELLEIFHNNKDEIKFLQNEITYDSALNSDWLMDVANFETLTTLIDEVTSNISGEKNQSKKKPERMNQPVLTSIT